MNEEVRSLYIHYKHFPNGMKNAFQHYVHESFMHKVAKWIKENKIKFYERV